MDSDAPNTTDMAETFRNGFRLMFVCILIMIAVNAGPYYLDDMDKFVKSMMFIGIPTILMGPIIWIYLFFQRFSFPGQVCAGGWLTDADYDKDHNVE